MKIFENISPAPEEIKIFNQREIEKHKELFSSESKHNGHKFFEINCATGEIAEAKYTNERIEFVDRYDLTDMLFASLQGRKPESIGKVPVTKRDIDSKENCLYVAALNLKNVKKKFAKFILEQTKPVKAGHEEKSKSA